MSNAQRLRTQALFDGYDQLTPGASGGGFGGFGGDFGYEEEASNPSAPYSPGPSGLDAVAAQQEDSDAILGPDGQPLDQRGSTIKTATLDPIAAPRVDPNNRESFQDYIKMMNEGYTPDYTSRDRLNKLLDTAPQRNKPGFGRALVAAGLSLKAQDPLATTEKVMYAPFYREAAEWKEKTEPFYKAADLENRQNINERTLMTNAATAYSASEKNRIAQENNESKNQISLIRANAYRAKQMGAEVKIEQGMVVAVYPDHIEHLGRVPGTSTDAELADIRGKYIVKAAQAAGAGVYNDPNSGAVTINPRDPNPAARRVPGTTGPVRSPGASQGAGDSALERGRVEQETIRKIMEIDPGARKQLVPAGNGTYRMKPRPVPHEDTWMPGDHVPQEDADEWDRVKKQIDPTYEPPPPTIPRVGTKGIGPSGAPTAAPNSNNRPVIGGSNTPVDTEGNPTGRPDPPRGEVTRDMPNTPPRGTIRMKTPDGRIVNVPANRVAEAEARGGRRLQ